MSYQKAATTAELGDEPLRVQLGTTPVVLVRAGEEIFAVAEFCTHEKESLAEGFVEECSIECPRHGAQFDLRTGEALTLPATQPLKTFATRIEGSEILVAIDPDVP
jgi:3-phenylpropionate/trans-cinnamate dioxygenase ferredoxin subunit